MLLSGLIVIILHSVGVLDFWDGLRHDTVRRGVPVGWLFAVMTISAILGISIAGFFSKIALRPIRRIIAATHKVAGGDFNIRLDTHGIYELGELSESFNKMTHELSTIETLRSDFINSFSHEFKTPIASIRGFAGLLKDDSLEKADRQEYLDIIITESERLSSLSENVLNLASYENLEIIADITEYRLDEQLRKAVIQMEQGWLKKNIEVNVDTDDVLYTGSAELMQQVLLNLIDNAIKFTEQGGAIDIRLAQNDDGIDLQIKDNGIGMDKETQSRIFDKFYQADSSRTGAGNGLGLSIVKRIIDLCNGTIEVQSEQNKGSEFIVRLPNIAHKITRRL